MWSARMIRHIGAQALEAGVAGFRPGVINPDIPIESNLHFLIRFSIRSYLMRSVRHAKGYGITDALCLLMAAVRFVRSGRKAEKSIVSAFGRTTL